MSRTMPSECGHGYIFDWGDFGCEDCADGEPHDGAGTHGLPERCPHGCNDAIEPVRTPVRLGAVPAPQMAPQRLNPHGSAVTAEPITVAVWEALHASEGFPVVDAADVEGTCEYTGEPRERCGCEDCGFDENYWDAKKDDLI